MRSFGYKGKPGTCLWCGRKLREDYAEVWAKQGSSELYLLSQVAEEPKPGDILRFRGEERRVRKSVPYVHGSKFNTEGPKRSRKAREGEKVHFFRVYFDPPVYDAYWFDEPMFDTQGCGLAFGLRLAELGHRLEKKHEER